VIAIDEVIGLTVGLGPISGSTADIGHSQIHTERELQQVLKAIVVDAVSINQHIVTAQARVSRPIRIHVLLNEIAMVDSISSSTTSFSSLAPSLYKSNTPLGKCRRSPI
jgi:hypothetical protein